MGRENWRDVLDARLPLLGHRNWVVVLDAAFPAFTSAGIEVLVSGEKHQVVLPDVAAAIRAAPHVDAVPLLAEEVRWVDAPGARQALELATGAKFMPHAEILELLDAVAARYRIFALKTTCTTPYTSVFFELACGYWSDAEEAALRQRMGG